MIKRVSVDQLQVGMYVCRIERGWVDTSFWSDGRAIASEAELQQLRECCQHAYVDMAKGDGQGARPAQAGRKRQLDVSGAAPGNVAALYRHSHSVLDGVFEDARLGGSIDGKAARAVVRDLTLGVLADSNALLCLTWLKHKNDSLARKSVNVCILTLAFGKAIGIPKAALHELGLGALLHDVGMLQVPDELLHKTDRLSAAERATVEKHVWHGLRMLAASRACSDNVLKIVHAHHEWVDGSGYPQGLKGNAIGLFPRMVSIVSVYEALTRERNYGKTLSPAAALRHLYGLKGVQFDARLVEKFIGMLGIYPSGCLVQLSSGEIGQVVSVSAKKRLRPTVRIVLDANGRPPPGALTIDLAQTQDVFVKQAVEPEQLPDYLQGTLWGNAITN